MFRPPARSAASRAGTMDCAWIMAGGAVVLAATGVLTCDLFRSAIDWPLLVFIGVS